MLDQEQEFSLKNFFSPLTTPKIIQIIVIMGLVVFSSGLFNNFVRDDKSQTVENPAIYSLSNIPKFFLGSTFYNGSNRNLIGVYYKPLLSTEFSLVYALFHDSYFAFHFFQLLFHLANTFLVYLLLRKFLAMKLAFLLSLIFLVHPVNSETVLYISATQEVMFFLFGMIALWVATSAQSTKNYIVASLCLLLALLSKEAGILFLGLVTLYKYLFNKKYLYQFIGIVIGIFCFYLLLRVNAIGLFAPSQNAPIDRLDLMHRLITIPEIIFFYLKTFIWPVTLSSSYHWVYTSLSIEHFFLPLIIDGLVLISMLMFGFWLYQKKHAKHMKAYLFFSIWFITGLAFHLQIIPLDVTVSERWFYFPIVGLLGMIGVLFEVMPINFSTKKGISVVCIVLALLSARTFVRSFDWKDDLTLASADIKVSPDAYDLENILSAQYLTLNKFDEARIHAEKSVKLFPYSTNYNNVGLSYLALGKYPKAKDAFTHALRYGEYFRTYDNLATIDYLTNEKPNNRRKFLIAALNKFPLDAKLWIYLALLEYKEKNIEAAQHAITQAATLDKSAPIANLYNQILNNQPVNIDFSY